MADACNLDKDKWIVMERSRWAKVFSVPMLDDLPPSFPPLTLGIMRALCALQVADCHQGRFLSALDLLFHEYWVKGTPTHRPEVLGKLLQQLLGEDLADQGEHGSLGLLESRSSYTLSNDGTIDVLS
jgi:2-hydroxychromene-2-carboxylate isomerase